MNKEDITRMAREAGFVGFDGDNGSLRRFAYLVEKHAYEKQLELPEPRLTGKFSITMGKFKCTGCTGLWDSSEQAKNHSCRDYQ
tara:strand:+ start:89 stop:340 length:252 start_codon:yes stop_codon:yes gene_type:complete